MFPFSFGITVSPKRKCKQRFCKILGWQTKSIMVFFVLANSIVSFMRAALIDSYDLKTKLCGSSISFCKSKTQCLLTDHDTKEQMNRALSWVALCQCLKKPGLLFRNAFNLYHLKTFDYFLFDTNKIAFTSHIEKQYKYFCD